MRQKFHPAFVTFLFHALQVEREGTNDSQMWALTKGAPEVVKEFLSAAPADYDTRYREFAAQGGR